MAIRVDPPIKRKDLFNQLRERLTSAESDLDHGRKRIGYKKMREVASTIAEYAGTGDP